MSRPGAVLVAAGCLLATRAVSVAAAGPTVGAFARKAQSRPGTEPWTPVTSGAALAEGSGLRTLERSSVELRLEAGGRVILGELTTITLTGARSLALIAGQLDVELPADATPVEVESKGTRIAVRSEAGPALARIRTSEAGPLAMAFGGAARAQGPSGATVELAAGSGAVLGGGAASEKLLAAPVTSVPAPGAAPDHANPRLWWEDVPGAGSYTVEVCRDEACAELEDRGVALVGAPWAPEGLPLGELFWRVCARSPAGLDGFPSRPVRFTIRSLWRKPHPRPRS